MSSGIHRHIGTPGTVHRSSVSVYKPSLQTLLSLTKSCHTPSGHIKILQNTSGGSLTLTSSSKRLLPLLSIKKPIIQLLVTSAQGHLDAYSDGGLFIIAFATDLVLRTLHSRQNSKVVAEVFEHLLTVSLTYLKTVTCRFKYVASVSNIKFMINYVRSILRTKPLCCLYGDKLDFVSRIVLETFLQSFSDRYQSLTVSEKVYAICTVGSEVTKSRIVHGLVLSAPDFSRFKTCDLKLKYVDCNNRKVIKVALVTISLSGDMEELAEVDFEVNQTIPVDDVILNELLTFCDFLIQSDVGLVLCQKVVHPKLKLSLQSAGIVVIDRLGIQPVKFVTNLTGCLPVQNTSSTVSTNCFGYIDNLQHIVLDRKSYLHLTRKDNPVTTVLLYQKEEQALQELKDVFMTSLEGLQQLLYTPCVLTGAGCWQTGLATYLFSKIDENLNVLSSDMECPASLIREAGLMFCSALLTAANIDSSLHSVSRLNSHVFKHSEENFVVQEPKYCCCGIQTVSSCDELVPLSARLDTVTKELADGDVLEHSQVLSEDVLNARDIVLDGFSMCMNAIQTAVLSASAVLKIGQVVENL